MKHARGQIGHRRPGPVERSGQGAHSQAAHDAVPFGFAPLWQRVSKRSPFTLSRSLFSFAARQVPQATRGPVPYRKICELNRIETQKRVPSGFPAGLFGLPRCASLCVTVTFAVAFSLRRAKGNCT